MGLRDIKNKARLDLHEEMKVPAFYYPPGGSVATPCFVRVHSMFRALGDIQSNQVGLAEREEMVPRLVFLASEIVPARAGIVTISATEGYRVDVVQPPDGLTITAFVIPLTASQMVGLSYPEEA